MKIYNIISAVIIVLFFTSCENEISFYVKENSPKLVVNAMINTNFEENYIFVSKTGKDIIGSVNDATINIYINEILKEQLTEFIAPGENDSDYYNPGEKKYKTGLRFNPGDKVKIEVFADNNKYHAWAEDIIPQPLEIDEIDTMTFIYDNETYIRLKTRFTDFPNEKNFYRLAVVQKNTLLTKNVEEGENIPGIYSEYEETIYIDTRQDRVLNNGRLSTDDEVFYTVENNYAIFDDKQLNSAYTMTTSFSRPDNSSFNISEGDSIERIAIEFKVHLISITEIQYKYLNVINTIYDESYDEYLSMPVAFPSNVEGGAGIVGFSSGTYKTFNIPDIISNTTNR